MSTFQPFEDRTSQCCWVDEDGIRCTDSATAGTPKVTACSAHIDALTATPVVPVPDPPPPDPAS